MQGWCTEGEEIVCADCVDEEEELNEEEQVALAV